MSSRVHPLLLAAVLTFGALHATRAAHAALDSAAADTAPGGKPVRNRLTFFNLGPDQVRQFSEQSSDGGATWTVVYDFNHLRRKT